MCLERQRIVALKVDKSPQQQEKRDKKIIDWRKVKSIYICIYVKHQEDTTVVALAARDGIHWAAINPSVQNSVPKDRRLLIPDDGTPGSSVHHGTTELETLEWQQRVAVLALGHLPQNATEKSSTHTHFICGSDILLLFCFLSTGNRGALGWPRERNTLMHLQVLISSEKATNQLKSHSTGHSWKPWPTHTCEKSL